MIKQTAAVLVLFIVTVIPLHCSLAAGKARGSAGGTEDFRLGDLDLRITESPADGGCVMRFSSNKELLFSGECAFKTLEPKAIQNKPLPNSRTLLAYCFSGGAHCCTTLFIATEFGRSTSLDMVDLAHSDTRAKFIEPDGTSLAALKISDWQFAYYSPEDSQIQLSFTDSPAMTRLLVYDSGHWRPDRIGEFSRFYSRLFRQVSREARIKTLKNEPESAAARAIKSAYYSLMSGESPEQATETLNQLLPVQWRPDSEKIVSDIHRAVSEFNPVEAIR